MTRKYGKDEASELDFSSLSLASLSLSVGGSILSSGGINSLSRVPNGEIQLSTRANRNLRFQEGYTRSDVSGTEAVWTPSDNEIAFSDEREFYPRESVEHSGFFTGKRVLKSKDLNKIAYQHPFSMSAGAGAEGKRSVRALFDEMLKRNSRIAPLGYSTSSSSNGGRSPEPRAEDVLDETNQISNKGKQKRILILMSDTGGGHRASAEAIKATFEQEYGDEYKVTVIDLWKEHTPWPFNQMPKSYSFLVKHETLWKVAFHVTKPRFVHQSQMAATSAFVAREVAKGLIMYEPDVIVSVHPLMQHVPLRVLKKKGLLHRIPFTTVITDLTTCHPTWFHKLVTLCFCPTNDVAQRALKAGLKSEQIRVHGLPIRPSFCLPTAPKDELRRRLGMDESLPAVILMGGGEGMGPVESTAKALAKEVGKNQNRSYPIGQLIVICGRNARLLSRLQEVDWPMPTIIKGFVNNMPEWMAASDCVISKAGPGTIAESMIRGLPMVLNDYIAGQEVGNVPFVVENGAGKYSENPSEIASIIAGWFGSNQSEFKAMAANALKLARPDAVFNIVRDINQLAKYKKLLP